MVERSFMVQWFVGSISPSALIKLFIVPSSAPQLVSQSRVCVSCLWDDAYLERVPHKWRQRVFSYVRFLTLCPTHYNCK